MDSIIDLVFLFDICLNFRTTFIDTDGEEIMDAYRIGMAYIKSSRFYLDLFSSIPFSDLFNFYPLKFLGILKIQRLNRIGTVIMNLTSPLEVKAAYKVSYLIFIMFMYIHICACIWYFIIKDNEEWVPNMSFILFGTP
jgi:hypothetical protein